MLRCYLPSNSGALTRDRKPPFGAAFLLGVPVLAKPPNIANDEFKSAKWDELAVDRAFS